MKPASLRTLLSLLIVSGVMLRSAKGADSNANRNISNSAATQAVRASVLEEYGRLPLSFEANVGQTDGSVRFVSRGNGYTLFLTRSSAVVSLSEGSALHTRDAALQSARGPTSLWMDLVGANPNAQALGSDELPSKSNYFIGNDPKQWHTGVPTFQRVVYKGIYPGIDLIYYGKQRQMEYDFVIAPGADPNIIKLKIEGSQHIHLDTKGNLLIGVDSDREVRLGAPVVYQEDAGKRHSLHGKWVRSGHHDFRFALGPYDRTKTLIVDPPLSLVSSTFLGGSSIDRATGVAVDSSGNTFITGFTGSANFPTTTGAFQTVCGGCTGAGKNNAFITELDPTGSTLLYSTFLGGNNGDAAFGIAIDGSGNAYVVGTTFSPNFPVTKPVFQATCAGGCTNGDAFVTEINSLGNQLVFSTFLGDIGNEKGNGIALDTQGNVYVTGSTNSTAFPTHNPIQSTFGGGAFDAFVTELNGSGTALVYSTYLGGLGDDEAEAIAVDSSGSAYVTGFTASTNFPTAGPIQSANAGGNDVFVTKYKPLGTALVYSTYLGGAAADSANSIALDSSNNAYVVGSTLSANFPTLNAVQTNCSSCSAASGDAFLTKINASGNAMVYSTFLGGSASDQANGVTVDAANNAFVVGQTSSTDFPLPNLNYEFQSACKSCATGGQDVFISEFDQAGTALIFSSYIGGTTTQRALAVALNPSEQAIIAGGTQSSDFPIQGPEQGTIGGGEDAFITAYPGAVNCTMAKLWSAAGTIVTGTVTCNGLFLPSPPSNPNNQFLGFVWGDGQTDGSGSGGGNNCAIPPGTCTFAATHSYAPGSYQGSPTVTDAANNNGITTGFSVTIPEIAIQTTSLPGVTVSTEYSQTLTAANGKSPYTWAIASGSLPAGLTLSVGGVISGIPTATGNASFTVQATDNDSQPNATQQALSILVGPPGALVCQPPTVTAQSASNPLSVSASSNCTDSASTITSTTIDWGDSSTSSGTSASHTYASSGPYTITVTATDAIHLSSSASQVLTVTAPVATAVPQGGTAQQTVSVTAPTGVASLQLTYQCVSANGPSGAQTLAFYQLSCNINNQGATASVTLTSTPTQITIAVLTDSTTAQNQDAVAKPSGHLFAAFLFLPAVVLIGAASAANGRKTLRRHTVLLLFGIVMTIGWLGCGGSSPPPPPKTPVGAYSVSLGGTDSSGSTQSTITVGFSVIAGG